MLTREEFNGRMRYLTIRETPVPKESKELEEQGYTIVRKAFNAKEMKALRTEINQVYDERQPDSRMRDKPDTNTPHHFRYEMFNHSPLCQTIAGRREILDVIEPLLGEDCHIIANICWRNPPGEMELNGGKWHLDGGPHIPLRSDQVWPENLPHPVFAIGAHIFLYQLPPQMWSHRGDPRQSQVRNAPTSGGSLRLRDPDPHLHKCWPHFRVFRGRCGFGHPAVRGRLAFLTRIICDSDRDDHPGGWDASDHWGIGRLLH